MPSFTVIEFTFSDEETDTEFIILCNGKRLIVRLFEDNFSESPRLKGQYLFFLRVAEEFELEGQTVEDFYDWVVEPFLPMLRAIPPLAEDATPTLEQIFFPETTLYTLEVVAGELSPILYEADGETEDDWVMFGAPVEDELASPWQSFRPSEIEICPLRFGQVLSTTPMKVQLAGGESVFFLKLVPAPDTQRAEEELRRYSKIKRGELEDELLISRLHGLVRDESGLAYGLLLTYIDCGNMTLTCASKPDSPVSLRRKWAGQVRSTVERLHGAGVTWGDAKADNVLIDVDDNAWVIDFGGGYTEGWVDKDSAGTVEGDLQGLAKMSEFLGV